MKNGREWNERERGPQGDELERQIRSREFLHVGT